MQLSNVERAALLAGVLAVIIAIGFWLRGGEEPAQPLAQVPTSSAAAPAARPAASAATAATAAGTTCTQTLLSREAILSRNGITLFMGHATGDGGVRLAERCRPAKLDALFALSARGVVAVSASPSQPAMVPWGCMKEIDAVQTRAAQSIEQDDLLVAGGTKVPEVLQWVPAAEADAQVECPTPRTDFQTEEQRTYQIKGLANRWVVESWRRAEDPAEIPQDVGTAPVPRVFRLVRVSAADQCEVQDTVDWSGASTDVRNPGQYRRIRGVLTAKDSNEEKSWMILESGSDDARAVVAVPLDSDKKQPQLRQQDFWLYSGC